MKIKINYPLLRVLIYSIITLGFIQFIEYAVKTDAKALFKEDSFVEYAEVFFLLVTSFLFLIVSLRNKDARPVSILMVGLFLSSVIREFDYFFDKRVFDGSWQIIVIIIFTGTAFLFWKHRFEFKSSLKLFISKSAFGYLMSGFITLFVFSRMFGRKVLWKAIMDDKFLRVVKDAAEECTELFGYLLIVFAAIEYYYAFKEKEKL